MAEIRAPPQGRTEPHTYAGACSVSVKLSREIGLNLRHFMSQAGINSQEIEPVLQVEPELRFCAEKRLQPQGHFHADRSLLTTQPLHTRSGDPQPLCGAVRG